MSHYVDAKKIYEVLLLCHLSYNIDQL